MGWEKISTEARMVKNLRVVVKMEQRSGPKVVTVMKIKFCNKIHKQSNICCQVNWTREMGSGLTYISFIRAIVNTISSCANKHD